MLRKFIYLFSWILISLMFAKILNINSMKYNEGFHNTNTNTNKVDSLMGNYPETSLILNDGNNVYSPAIGSDLTATVDKLYPGSGNSEISSNTAADIWWHYPIFRVGSFAQITNNLKYPKNPDNGTCTPASMCQTLYLNRASKPTNNEVFPLPPLRERAGAAPRVN